VYVGEVRAAAALLCGCVLAGCPGPRRAAAPPTADSEGPAGRDAGGGPEAVLTDFVAALEAGRWPEAYALLSARWRARYTPERLAADWGAAGPVSRDAAARVAALLASGAAVPVEGRRARLPVGDGKAAQLLLEEGRWRIDALE
jgi:hypothetical protein